MTALLTGAALFTATVALTVWLLNTPWTEGEDGGEDE